MISRSLWGRLSRVIIASLSIAVGAATLSGLGLIAYTVPAQMAKELRSYGANLVVIPTGNEPLTGADLAAADAVVERGAGDSLLGRAGYEYTNLLYNQQPISVVGVNFADVGKVRTYWEVSGAVPKGEDEMLVGEKVAERYRFSEGDQVGLTEPTRADGVAMNLKTVGLLHTGGAEDEQVMVSQETFAKFVGGEPRYDLIEYSVGADSAELDQLAAEINDLGPNMQAEVVRRLAESESGIAQTLQALIWIVAAIISVLTVISISATLNAVVSERSREIGLKKALGADARDVTGEFIGESVLLGLLGGGVGVAAGIWLAREVSVRAFAVQLVWPWWIIPATLVFSVAIAVVGSLAPARRISRINPVDVLGGE